MGYIRLMFAAIIVLTIAVCFFKYIMAPIIGWIRQTPAPMPSAPAAPQAPAPQVEADPTPAPKARTPKKSPSSK